MSKTVLDASGASFSLKTTTDGGDEVTHNNVDSIAQPSALSTQTVTSTGAASTVTFASGALVSGVIYVYADSANTGDVWINKVGSAASEGGILVAAGTQVQLPPCDNANLYQAYFAAASPDNLTVVAS